MVPKRKTDTRSEMEKKLQKQTLELKRSNEDLEHFAFVASHDLQAPLRRIHSFVELLQENLEGKIDDDEETKEYMRYIVECIDSMTSLINNLLVYSRASKEVETERVNLNEVLAEVIATVKSAGFGEFDVKVAHLPEVEGNRAQFIQIFQNLISNAVKYQRWGSRAEVSISVVNENGEWKFEIADNGIGIEPRYRERVFKLFQRLDSRQEGAGVGLAVCNRIIQRNGGHIWIEDNKPYGSRFLFTLPLSQAETLKKPRKPSS